MKYNILDKDGNIVNVIIANEEFVKDNFEFYKLVDEEITIAPIEVPQTLTPRQIRMQLTNSGLEILVKNLAQAIHKMMEGR